MCSSPRFIPHLVVHGDPLPVLKVAAVSAGSSRARPGRHRPGPALNPGVVGAAPLPPADPLDAVSAPEPQPSHGSGKTTSGPSVSGGPTLWSVSARARARARGLSGPRPGRLQPVEREINPPPRRGHLFAACREQSAFEHFDFLKLCPHFIDGEIFFSTFTF